MRTGVLNETNGYAPIYDRYLSLTNQNPDRASSRFVKLGGKAQRGMTEAARALAKGRASDLPGR